MGKQKESEGWPQLAELHAV